MIEKLVARGEIHRKDRVVCVSTANALKFTEFKVRYHDGQVPGVASSLANPAVTLKPDYGQVVDAITARFS